MKIVHQISSDWTKDQAKVLEERGIHVKEGYERLTLIEDETYLALREQFKSWGALDMVGTVFDTSEIEGATSVMLHPDSQSYYPQPETEFGYLKYTYDLANYCFTCGIGAKQIRPFRLRSEPKWGRKKAFMLNWVFDEMFVTRDAYDQVFRPLDIGCTPVLLDRDESHIKTTVQLNIPESRTALALDGYPCDVCASCGRKRYRPITRGWFPPFDSPLSMPLCKSQEYYGSGASSSKWIFAAKSLRETLVKHEVGMTYVPLRELTQSIEDDQ
jgi:hypothetical protein